jgi:hypothetical protein
MNDELIDNEKKINNLYLIKTSSNFKTLIFDERLMRKISKFDEMMRL